MWFWKNWDRFEFSIAIIEVGVIGLILCKVAELVVAAYPPAEWAAILAMGTLAATMAGLKLLQWRYAPK